MPTITIKKGDSVTEIGPLAAATDFQVLDGACSMSTAAFAADNLGFTRLARSGTDSWRAGAGKTLRLSTTTRATIHYEALE